MKRRILIVLGTRPEVIKLAPVILALREHSDKYEVTVCNTEQQKELSNQTLAYFGLEADMNLDVMRPNQSLASVQCRILSALDAVYDGNKIDATVVQGDTMTVFCGALASYYHKVPVFHVEAGLRSYNLFEPFPEEAMRQMTARITALHFAPTDAAVAALKDEAVRPERICKTGNTVIDALSCLSDDVIAAAERDLSALGVDFSHETVLVTVHRRENHGERLDMILDAIARLATDFSAMQFVVPVHPNPNVHDKIVARLRTFPNIVLTNPLDYPLLVSVMKRSKLVMTDSGGIQEEAPSLGVPVLVMRYETERKEGVEAGFSKLVGADRELIIKEAAKILGSAFSATRKNGLENPYGDGTAARRIINAMDEYFNLNPL